MAKDKSSAFRARLLGVAGNSLTLEVLDGKVSSADELLFCSSSQTRKVLSLREYDGHILAEVGSAVEAKIGEIVAGATQRPECVDQFEAEILWLSAQDMLPGRSYSLVCAGQLVDATVTKLKYKVEEASAKHIAANSIAHGETFIGNLSLSRKIVFDPISTGLKTSQFELRNGDTKVLAKGEIRHSLRRASNVYWQTLAIDKAARSKLKHQTPKMIWLTGLSASGKSTIANIVEKKLLVMGRHAYLLDGDNVRHGLNKDLGFTAADRVENIRRIAETGKLMLDAGLIVITSFISPFRDERRMARSLFEEGEFIEVHIDASLAVCEERDPKGLYKKVRQGALSNFTGFDSPYDIPENPEIKIDTEAICAEDAAARIIDYLKE